MVTLEVSGMVCGACAASVTRAIEARDPAAKVRIDREAGRVEAETSLSPEAAAEAVVAAGYEARPAANV